MEQKQNPDKNPVDISAIFLIDFDGTIADGHTHNAVAFAVKENHITNEKKSHWDFLRKLIHHGSHHPLGSAQEWQKVFATLLADGHKVGIISFSSYPHMIENYLREIVGLSENVMSQVYVYAHLPPNPGHANKNAHIEMAKKHFEYNGPNHRVVLIDDSFRNIVGAQMLGCTTIAVDEKNSHLQQILELSTKLKASPKDAPTLSI